VAAPLRQRLLDYAARIGAPYPTRVRASEVMAQPRGSLPHDDHFHVRISCPSGMEACIEQPTRNLAHARYGAARAHAHAVAVAPPAASAHPPVAVAAGHPKSSTPANADLPALPRRPDAPAASIDAKGESAGVLPASPPIDAKGESAGVLPARPPIGVPIESSEPIDDVDGVEE
jgi:penicillin-insensitive murein endopeptidase